MNYEHAFPEGAPPVSKNSKKDRQDVEKVEPVTLADAQIRTADWLKAMGVVDDEELLADTEVADARKAFAGLTADLPPEDTKRNMLQLRTPTAISHLVGMLTAYDWEFVEHAKEIRNMAVAKLVEEINHPDAKIRLKAIELLGKVTEVNLFTDRVEVHRHSMSDAEIETRIKDKLNRFMTVIDVVEEVAPEPPAPTP